MHPLLNMVFLSFSTRQVGTEEYRVVEWQGKVVEVMGRDLFLVQLYSWLIGEPGPFKVVRADEMADWQFYADWEDLDWEYSHVLRYGQERYAQAVLNQVQVKAFVAEISPPAEPDETSTSAPPPKLKPPIDDERTLKAKQAKLLERRAQ